ncbi:MAG: rod shape-determining protein, partial [Prevotellaceae bacterium]|nr:rod shape-determining protein [Prevotellaceae bacterium]
EVYMIYEPMAAAIGIGIDVEAPEGNMVVDIGGGSTEIAVISLGGIVSNKSIRIAGDDLTADIVEYMGRQHNVRVGERTAELIKINVGAALTDLEDAPEDYVVHGPNRMTALPLEVPVSYQEVAHCLEKSISKIEAAILGALEQTPPELYADIVRKGIYLAGGGALLRGLDKRLSDKINIPFHIAEDPLRAVARGTGIALKNVDKFSFLMR